MKKIIALALALIMALSMASVAFAATATAAPAEYLNTDLDTNQALFSTADGIAFPGEAYEVVFEEAIGVEDETVGYDEFDSITLTKDKTRPNYYKNFKLTYDFTTDDFSGASYVEDVKVTKEGDAVRITLKENLLKADETAKEIYGEITFTHKTIKNYTQKLTIKMAYNNGFDTIAGVKKAADAEDIFGFYGKNFVTIMDEDGGYVKFDEGELTGVVKMEKNEKVQLIFDEDAIATDKEAIEDALGEDYEAIVEYYTFGGTGFKNDVAFSYKAYEEDPHFFYVWDGETFKALDVKYDADEEVDAYVWTGAAEGILVITDTEIVLAEEETKNPDTGANDVVGVAAALAVVSLVAAGAVSLKK